MTPNRNFLRELTRLEDDLARDVSTLARLLEARPSERDAQQVIDARNRMVSSRRRLGAFLRSGRRMDGTSGSQATREERQERDAVRKVKDRLRLWQRFDTIVEAQLNPARRELMAPIKPRDGHPEVMDHVVSMFLEMFHALANPDVGSQLGRAAGRGSWGDVPYPMDAFSRIIGAAYRVCLAQRRPRPLRFLDVGSGGGTKVLAATSCFDLCDGLEFDEDTVRSGRKLLDVLAPSTCRLIHGDALDFDHYGDYDVIYLFRPIVDTDRTIALENRILSQATRGTVLAVAGGLRGATRHETRVQKLVDPLFVVGMSPEESVSLRQQAEEMGTMVPGNRHDRTSDYGYWQPLREVCARNGYHV